MKKAMSRHTVAAKSQAPIARSAPDACEQEDAVAAMAPLFGHDFSKVRIHADEEAAAAARELNAAAYTAGHDIFFGAEQYAPHSRKGRALLAHELTHIVQADNARGSSASAASSPVAELEREADSVAAAAASGQVLSPIGGVAAGGTPLLAGLPPKSSTVDDVPTFGNLMQDRPMMGSERRVVELKQEDGVWYEMGRYKSRARGSYDFVVKNDRIFAIKGGTRGYGHTEAAAGERVSFAGQVRFGGEGGNPGQLIDWTNISGHYAPPRAFADNAVRAGLPRDKFVPYTGPKGEMGPQLPVVQPQPGINTPPPETRSPGTVDVAEAGGKAPGVGNMGEAVVEGALRSTPQGTGVGELGAAQVEAAEVSAGETAAAGITAGEVAGVVLAVAVEAVIAIAISLLIEWLVGLVEKSILERDIRALNPDIQARLGRLGEKIAALQKKGKVYARISIDVQRLQGHAFEQGYPAVWNRYERTSLVSVDVSGEQGSNTHGETEERLSANEARTHYLESFSTLIDDPEKRAREKQNAQLVEKLRREAAKHPAASTPSSGGTSKAPPLLPTLGPPPVQQSTDLLPGAPGPGPLEKARAAVAEGKRQVMALLARGERLVSSSADAAAIDSFKHDEDIWRTAATLAKNYFTDHGPDEGQRGFDELLNSDQYGGRLKQIRQTLGG
jgi:hypothetical protein